MCIATEQICSKCNNKYWQSDLREDEFLICKKCRGYPEPLPEPPFEFSAWKEMILSRQHR